MRGKGCVSDSFLRLSEGNEETARYKRRNSRPKGRIRFRKDALEPTNSLTRRNCPRASFIRVYSDDKARWSNPLIFWMCYSSQFQFDDCKSLPELGRIEHVSLAEPPGRGRRAKCFVPPGPSLAWRSHRRMKLTFRVP
jgi:hypothetical protein